MPAALLMLCLLLIFPPFVTAQRAEPVTMTAYEDTVLYDGPGITYLTNGRLDAGVPVEVVERNQLGNWLRVTLVNDAGETILDGWTKGAYLNPNSDLRLSRVPVNREIADADPANVRSRSMAQLYTFPVIPQISDAMIRVFTQGQEAGNNANVITKVGDSLSANTMYLEPFSRPGYDLGAYDDLEAALQFFGASTAEPSIAAQVGMTSYVIFDPFWANSEQCQPNETPLACEYRLKRPSVAFIMFGANDVNRMTYDEFNVQIRQIVDETLAQHVIPVLSTFSYHPDEPLWWQSVEFNLRLTEIASEYEIPLINLWAAARELPDYGLEVDLVHLKNSGFETLNYATGHEAWYGVSLQNLLALRTLDELYTAVGAEED